MQGLRPHTPLNSNVSPSFADPAKDANAKRYDKLDYDDVLERKLDVMDATAIVLCRENKMPLRVVDMTAPGAFVAAALGQEVGTLVTVIR